MDKQLTELSILEADGENIFDQIASILEKGELSYGRYKIHRKTEISQLILEIENGLIDIEERQQDLYEDINKLARHYLKDWFSLWATSATIEPVSEKFYINLRTLKEAIFFCEQFKTTGAVKDYLGHLEMLTKELKSELRRAGKGNIHEVIWYNIKTFIERSRFQFVKAVRYFITSTLDKLPQATKQPEKSHRIPYKPPIKQEYKYQWNITIKVAGNTNTQDFTYFLWTFTESLETIEGVKVEILSIKKGSWIIKLKVFFKNYFSKVDGIQVLENARESALSYIEKPAVELEKSKSEIQKNTAETEKAIHENQILPSEIEAKQLTELNIQKLSVEIESAKMDTVLKKLAAIEKVSELAKSGYLKVDELQIEINDLLYFLKKGDHLELGNSMDSIENNENNDSPIE